LGQISLVIYPNISLTLLTSHWFERRRTRAHTQPPPIDKDSWRTMGDLRPIPPSS